MSIAAGLLDHSSAYNMNAQALCGFRSEQTAAETTRNLTTVLPIFGSEGGSRLMFNSSAATAGLRVSTTDRLNR